MAQVRALIYTRVSTDAQEREGTSLDTQERGCVQYAQAQGWHVVERVRDTATGSSLDRPGIERIRRLLREGSVDVLVAYAVDRLSRNQNHIGVLFDEVEQAGAKLEFVTENFEDTAVGRFILAAKAFVAEVEREKIVERTMRGKLERARSGRLPQATGKGCYGYIYDRATGQRVIEPRQVEVVRRVFDEFLSGVAIVKIANRLNGESVPSFLGGIWYPATLHRLLRNETYTGRTVYRRTRTTKVRDPRTGKAKRRVEQRGEADWVEVVGASPAIIERDTFEAAQRVLDDPERRRIGRRLHDYGLSGRLKCRKCGKAMVGQTINGGYRYYRCRRAFAGPRHDRCETQYVPATDLEGAVKREAARVLANPEIILAEAERLASRGPTVATDTLQQELESLDRQRSRLLKLYQMGELDDGYLQAESMSIRKRREDIERQLPVAEVSPQVPEIADLKRAAEAVAEWLMAAEGDDFDLLLDALQIQVSAEKGAGELLGVLPDYSPTNGHADVCAMVTKSPALGSPSAGPTNGIAPSI